MNSLKLSNGSAGLLVSIRRLKHIGARFFYRSLPAGLRLACVARLGRAWEHFCPVCEDRVSGFAPLAGFYSRNLERFDSDLRLADFETCNFAAYQCSHCGASDRDRIYALYLGTRMPADAGAQAELALLDIAPSAALAQHIRRRYTFRYRTADLFQEDVDDQVDITRMDCYQDCSFDAFICSHVLEHVEDDRQAMKELWRVLKPGGWGIAMAPISTRHKEVREGPPSTPEGERWRLYGQGDHLRLYTREGFTGRLRDAGFRVSSFGSEHFTPETMKRCGLSVGSVLYVVEKTVS